MSSTSQLAKRFREVILDGLWIANTNFKDQLSDINLEAGNNEIWFFKHDCNAHFSY